MTKSKAISLDRRIFCATLWTLVLSTMSGKTRLRTGAGYRVSSFNRRRAFLQ
jgi:hypothetical protein